ncbi:MAG TPA: hypothetical protein VK279_01070 [Solirubrobacteraceae bacterium]|nr:hypothetical protein [Solirubrobacteraceae bacterium]
MKEIRITPGVQVVGLVALLAAIAAAVATQAPEIQRYLKVRSM